MRKAFAAIVLALFAARVALGDPDKPATWTRTVPLSPSAAELLGSAPQRSPIVALLLRQLEDTDVSVYLADMKPTRNGTPASTLVYLSNEGATRYLLVRIDPWRVSMRERIALLGHELQHALEVAASPEVRDSGGLETLYRRIGWEWMRGQFETRAAQVMGNRVRAQLAAGRS